MRIDQLEILALTLALAHREKGWGSGQPAIASVTGA